MLGVEPDCADQELKEAYLEKAKAFHPDSALASADPFKFGQVKDAYKAVLVGFCVQHMYFKPLSWLK